MSILNFSLSIISAHFFNKKLDSAPSIFIACGVNVLSTWSINVTVDLGRRVTVLSS